MFTLPYFNILLIKSPSVAVPINKPPVRNFAEITDSVRFNDLSFSQK